MFLVGQGKRIRLDPARYVSGTDKVYIRGEKEKDEEGWEREVQQGEGEVEFNICGDDGIA
jgi:hypothetical protein